MTAYSTVESGTELANEIAELKREKNAVLLDVYEVV